MTIQNSSTANSSIRPSRQSSRTSRSGAAVGASLLLLYSFNATAASGGRMMQLDPDTPTMEVLQEKMLDNTALDSGSPLEVQDLAVETSDPTFLEPAPNGPGCDVTPANSAVGADVAQTYFGPPPSTVNPSLVGPLELLTAGQIDRRNLTVTLPLYRGEMTDGRNVFYIVTDTTDQGNAEGLGINFSPKLTYAETGRAVRKATLQANGILVFEKGTVNFAPERQLKSGGEGNAAFPPMLAKPGAVGDYFYSPLVRIENAGGHIYNAPIIAFDVDANEINFPDGNVDYSRVHDHVLAIDPFAQEADDGTAGTVTLSLTPGFSFGKPVLYLSTEASAPDVAAIERNTFAPGLKSITLGFDDSLFSAVERLFSFTNGATGCDNPQRQGLAAAIADGETPFNVLGGIPTVATDYSPLWDVNLGEWTQDSIDRGFRSRLTDEFQILTFVQNGFITGPGGTDYGSAGFVVNCPIVFRYL